MATTPKKKPAAAPPEPKQKMKTGNNLATTERPKEWSDVCGQTKIVQRLKGMVKTQEIPNAIMFSGPSGTGKTTLSRVFARYLNCETMDSCGTCDSCLAMDVMRHPDYVELNLSSERGIADIKNVMQQARFMPTMGNIRVVMLDEYHGITPQANEAFLKMLEEPPESTLFIISTSEPEKVNAAAKGRCQQMQLVRVGPEYVADHLVAVAKKHKIKGISPEIMLMIAEATGGQLRDALQTLDGVVQTMRGQEEELEGDDLEALIRSSVVECSTALDDQVATKVLLYLHAKTIKDKPTIKAILKALIEVQNPIAFTRSMLFQNGYLIDIAVDPKNPSIYHTVINKTLVRLLNEKVDTKANYGSAPSLNSCLVIQTALMELLTKLMQVSGQEKGLMQVLLAGAYSNLTQE